MRGVLAVGERLGFLEMLCGSFGAAFWSISGCWLGHGLDEGGVGCLKKLGVLEKATWLVRCCVLVDFRLLVNGWFR